jgi:hypothetical protein
MPVIIFGGGKMDITDRQNRSLGNINISNEYIKYQLQHDETKVLDYNKLIVSNSTITYLPIISIHKLTDFVITNIRNDSGTLDRTYKHKTAENIHYVNDIRHSHDLDTQDTSTITVYAGNANPVPITYDYSNILNVKYLFVRFAFWTGSSSHAVVFTIKISTDGSNWTTIDTFTTTSTSAVAYSRLYSNLTFRYLRFEVQVPTAGANGYAQVNKIVIFLS